MHFKLFSLGVFATLMVSLASALPFPQPGSSTEVAATRNYQENGQHRGRINMVNKRFEEADEPDENDNENDFEIDFGGEA